MPDAQNTQVLLKSRPTGEAEAENFEIVRTPVPEPAYGQALVRVIYLSVDPYMRGRMRPGRSYAKPVKPGQVMCGGTVGQVVRSRAEGLAEGDYVVGQLGWQEYGVAEAGDLHKVDAGAAPISTALGVLGMPGMTAYVGMLDIGQPKAGQTVLVSAAAGAVGSAAGQIAKLRGCRVVGTAGSDEKCRIVTEEFGFDACVNYKTQDLFRGLREHCGDGIDVYFDNVGGPVLETALLLANDHARIPLCGLISQYNATEASPGPNLALVLIRRITIQGLLVTDHAHRRDEFLRDMTPWVAQGKVRYRETITDGLENAPAAFMGLFHGRNVGKQLVRVSNVPT